jgi:hypothetical protein
MNVWKGDIMYKFILMMGMHQTVPHFNNSRVQIIVDN